METDPIPLQIHVVAAPLPAAVRGAGMVGRAEEGRFSAGVCPGAGEGAGPVVGARAGGELWAAQGLC